MYYPNDPQDFPADSLRLVSALVLLVIYVGTSLMYDNHLIKAICMVPVVSMMVIALYLSFYGRPWTGYFWIIVFAFHAIIFIRRLKMPNYTYYALIYAIVLAIAYSMLGVYMAKLIVFTGGLATLKTTLSKQISKDLGILCLNKDDLKAVLVDHIGFQNREENKKLSVATVQAMIERSHHAKLAGQNIIIEANF